MHEHRYNNFLSLPPECSTYATARYAVLPVPYEGTVSYEAGTAKGPSAILDASRHVEKLDEEFLAEFVAAGITTCKPLRAARTPEQMMRRVHGRAAAILADGKFLLTLGGEHSISAPLVAAATEARGELSVLQIDAHADLRMSLGGTTHSHGAVMRRILEITPRVCQVGIRSFSKEELEACPDRVRDFFTPARIAGDRRWIDQALKLLGPRVYITIDIDGLDPAFAPGTGTPEPGGLDYLQVIGLLRRVCGEREVVAADIVEAKPLGGSPRTEFLAARLAYKIITYTQACPAAGFDKLGRAAVVHAARPRRPRRK